jgi:predicted SAM-dependent methyltransferase
VPGLKINFGCGGNILDGWDNHDADLDITKPLPYADDVADYILAEHLCEHVTSGQFLSFMEECRRILKPGGRLRLCIPVLDRLGREHAIDIVKGHGHKAAYTIDSLKSVIMLLEWSQCIWDVGRDSKVDGHWRMIGNHKDELETFRILCVK